MTQVCQVVNKCFYGMIMMTILSTPVDHIENWLYMYYIYQMCEFKSMDYWEVTHGEIIMHAPPMINIDIGHVLS